MPRRPSHPNSHRPKGSITRKIAHNARYRVWQVMRMHKGAPFTVPALAAEAEAGIANVRKYLLKLCRAGYLRRTQAPVSQRGRAGAAVYVLVNDTGPHAPRAHEDGTVFDPNLAERRA